MIALSNLVDLQNSYKNVRMVQEKTPIMILNRWDLEFEDKNLFVLNANEIIASRFADFLPGIPVLAQNVGLGVGEIMEVKVPFGSSYVYRHISSIEQNSWKIAAIYRGQNMILPRSNIMIQPNDILLLIGSPNVLQNVYNSIKRELGQFPAPFGDNLYCYINMMKMGVEEIKRLTDDALTLHARFNNKKLIIKIVNPTDLDCIEKLKSYANRYVEVIVEYRAGEFEQSVAKDIKRYNIGLMIVTNRMFSNKKTREVLAQTGVAIFKISDRGVAMVKVGGILAYEGTNKEKMSSIVYDVSKQLELHITIYDFDPDDHGINHELIDHYRNLSKLYSTPIDIQELKNNPILELSDNNEILYFINFNKNVVDSGLLSYFSTNFEKLHFKFEQSNQIFIPTE
jgi:hypothetical protein